MKGAVRAGRLSSLRYRQQCYIDAVELLLHPSDDAHRHRPGSRGRLSTVGHAGAFRAFARVAKAARIRFMVVGGTFRDVAIRAASTRDIDVVLIDCAELPKDAMARAGFRPVAGSKHAWQYHVRSHPDVDLEVAALASSTEVAGPFSVAYQHSRTIRIEGVTVRVPRLEDFVILKLLAAAAEIRRRSRDLADIQYALEAFPDEAADGVLSVARLRARMRDLYGIGGEGLKELVSLLRQVRSALA
jgi:predicted nucleotidyltransferase